MVHFTDPAIEAALQAFLGFARDALGCAPRSVILYGSITWGDLAPGYGDLDFVAVVDDDIEDDRRHALMQARKPLRSGRFGVYGEMIEGAFLPRHMLCPGSAGRAVWWGTSGERLWDANGLGWFDCLGIRERGIVVRGDDLRHEFPVPSPEQLVAEAARFTGIARAHGKAGELHSVDWLLSAARALYWLKEGALTSKSHAAEWASQNAMGDWSTRLPRAAWLRRNPDRVRYDEVIAWLGTLRGPIEQACDEIERELERLRA